MANDKYIGCPLCADPAKEGYWENGIHGHARAWEARMDDLKALRYEMLAGEVTQAEDGHFIADPRCHAWAARLSSIIEQHEKERAEEMEARRILWLSHGHQGIYGDDGEMQCALCTPYDYKRAPLDDVVQAAIRALTERAKP